MQTNSKILDFVKANLLEEKLVVVLQVGSSARGYSTSSSDIDFMAFYESENGLISKPHHSIVDETNLTLEHHCINDFNTKMMNVGYNFSILRQLYKIRDSKIFLGDNYQTPEFVFLKKFSEMASLDKSILLSRTVDICEEFLLLGDNKSYNLLKISKWIETLGVLNAMTTKGSPAYSKPKWLYKTLKNPNLKSYTEVLNKIYEPLLENIALVKTSINDLISSYDFSSVGEQYYRLFQTAINDVISILESNPKESIPCVIFFATIIHNYFENKKPEELLLNNLTFVKSQYKEIFSFNESKYHDIKSSFSLILLDVIENLRKEYQTLLDSKIGSIRFANHILSYYGLDSVMSNNISGSIIKMIDQLSLFKEQILLLK